MLLAGDVLWVPHTRLDVNRFPGAGSTGAYNCAMSTGEPSLTELGAALAGRTVISAV